MNSRVTEIVVDIVSAFVANNRVPASNLAQLIADTHKVLDQLAHPETIQASNPPKPEPAVPIRKSVTPDFLISLEDGKKYKSLKRHLSGKYGMTPAEYRDKWGLPADYPMVAPSYARQRSELAKALGLGKGGARRKLAKK